MQLSSAKKKAASPAADCRLFQPYCVACKWQAAHLKTAVKERRCPWCGEAASWRAFPPPDDLLQQIKDVQLQIYIHLFHDFPQAIIHLARLGAEGRADDVKMYARTRARKFRASFPELAGELRKIAGPGNILRKRRKPADDNAAYEVPVKRRK